jgi:hypothetical protein
MVSDSSVVWAKKIVSVNTFLIPILEHFEMTFEIYLKVACTPNNLVS